MRKLNARGFSLVEMIVVLAIVGIVAVFSSSLLLNQLRMNSATERKVQVQDHLTLQKLALTNKDVCLKTFEGKEVTQATVASAPGQALGFGISEAAARSLEFFLGEDDTQASLKHNQDLPGLAGSKLTRIELRGISNPSVVPGPGGVPSGLRRAVGELLLETTLEQNFGGNIVRRSIPMQYTFDAANKIVDCEASNSGGTEIIVGGGGNNGNAGGNNGNANGNDVAGGAPPSPTIGPIVDMFDANNSDLVIPLPDGREVALAAYNEQCTRIERRKTGETCTGGGMGGRGMCRPIMEDFRIDTCGGPGSAELYAAGATKVKKQDFTLAPGTNGIPSDAKFVQLQVFSEGNTYELAIKSKDGKMLGVPLRPGSETTEDKIALCAAQGHGFTEDTKTTCIRTVEVPVGNYEVVRRFTENSARYDHGSARIAVTGYRGGGGSNTLPTTPQTQQQPEQTEAPRTGSTYPH